MMSLHNKLRLCTEKRMEYILQLNQTTKKKIMHTIQNEKYILYFISFVQNCILSRVEGMQIMRHNVVCLMFICIKKNVCINY